MNKNKKIAIAAVSMVMAGSMALSFAACGGNGGGGSNANDLLPTVNADGKLTYTAGTELQFSIGYNSGDTGITYTSANITTLGGHRLMGTQSELTLKPAWAALQTKLGLSFKDLYTGESAGNNLGNIKNSTAGLSSITAFTASVATINAEATSGNLLDLNRLLDYMPNYKAFLEANPIVWASLISNATTGSMYTVPYFDGNNDIEKYVLIRKDLVEALLIDGDLTKATTTFAAQASAKNAAPTGPVTTVVGTSASVSSFMGTTGSWTIDVTDPSVLTEGEHTWGNDDTAVTNSTATVKVKIDYTAAHDAAVNTSSALGAALSDAAGKAYTGESGNIVDLQNFAINETNGAVTGGQLLAILRAYIDVAYQTESGAPFYASTNSGLTRASVFNSASAAWDADLYTALGRCFVTSGTLLGGQVKDVAYRYLVTGREYTTQRNTDVGSLAGELYGERGLESRYNYSYITKDGELEDGRSNESMWDALAKMNDLAKEGLLNTSDNITKDKTSISTSANQGVQGLSLHDYVQTQTSAYGFDDGAYLDGYNFAPILTPISKWDVDGNAANGKEVTMRFTESWRGVKDGGIAISATNIGGDANKLAAVLAFIDYCYSSDGQMLMTYGPMSTNGNTDPNGLWYANEVTGVNITDIADVAIPASDYCGAQYALKTTENSGIDGKTAKESYFIYEGKVYTGTFYNGRQIPILTDESQEVFATKEAHNFTNYARQLLGTTLPVWNKDQGFEYLCTAPCGLAGSDIVSIALNNGTIKHQYQTLDGTTGEVDADGNVIYAGDGTAADPNFWYTLVPTQLPYINAVSTALRSSLSLLSGLGSSTDNFVVNSSSTKRNIITDIMFYGYNATTSIPYVSSKTLTLGASAAAMVDMMEASELSALVEFKNEAWHDLLYWYSTKV